MLNKGCFTLLFVTQNLKRFWKMAQKKSQFPLTLILGQNWFLYWDFFKWDFKHSASRGREKSSLNFLFRYCSWWNSAKLPRQITTLTTLFPFKLKRKVCVSKCIFPILSKSVATILSFRTLKVGPIFTPTPCFAWIIAFSLEISSLLRLSQSKHF